MGSFYVVNPDYLEVPIMSRTKRYIPHWARYPRPYELCWKALGTYHSPLTGEDPRNRMERGYDKHHHTSYLRIGAYWWDDLPQQGKRRGWYKRVTSKTRRRNNKLLTKNDVFEHNQKDE